MRRVRRILAILGVCLATIQASASPSAAYQRIGRLSMSDLVFKQVQDSISQGYRAEKLADTYPDLFFCLWTAAGGEDLYAVAARLALPYETLATLNGMGRPRSLVAGENVIIPSIAGVFVPDQPRNDLDLLLSARLDDSASSSIHVIVDTKAGRLGFTFYPGSRFFGTERSFFLNIGFRMPLPKAVLTSGFGFRKSPIDGHDRMHEGIDLAAPAGTEVMAARDGTVVFVGTDPVLGLHLIISHEGGLQTVYGHLSSVAVVLNQTVRSGTIVGAVGSTGLSTGPHLHFEIRLSGAARDPSSYLPGLKR